MDDTRPEVGEGKPARRPASLWWRLTVGLVIPLLAAAACLVVLWSLVPPVVFYPLYVLAWGALIIVGVVWLAAVVFGSIRYGWRGVTLVAPVIVLVTVGLAAAELPGRFGWWVSKDDLQRAAVACADPADAADVRSQRIGVYRVHSVQRVGDRGCRFTVEAGWSTSWVSPICRVSGPTSASPAATGTSGIGTSRGLVRVRPALLIRVLRTCRACDPRNRATSARNARGRGEGWRGRWRG